MCACCACVCVWARARTERVRTSVYEEPIVRQSPAAQSSDHCRLSLLLSDMRIPTRAAPRPPGQSATQRDPIWSSRYVVIVPLGLFFVTVCCADFMLSIPEESV